ncbi:MAG: hypothetical protein M9945_14420 [Aquamicrobium sp.]|uniref:hypothetical protein n=1 Tax=Aquamicrobium sp. TaxID=1872579 RepID=UPI00349EC0B1|nr:hypothetical protein [Aquamicrobium sp.]
MVRHDPTKDHPEIIAIKAEAAEIKRAYAGLSQSQAIEAAAHMRGFKTYAAFLAGLEEETP